MFVDICYASAKTGPVNEMARRLGTDRLCFIYPDAKHTDDDFALSLKPNKKYPVLLPVQQARKAEAVYYYDGAPVGFSLHHPPLGFSQVLLKQLEGKPVAIPFSVLLKNPERVYNFRYFAELCKKYNVRLFMASFASSPYELRAASELRAMMAMLGFDRAESVGFASFL